MLVGDDNGDEREERLVVEIMMKLVILLFTQLIKANEKLVMDENKDQRSEKTSEQIGRKS